MIGQMLGQMLGQGVRVIGRRKGLVASLYAVQLGFTLVTMYVVSRVLDGLYDARPLFDRGVHGDLVALLAATLPHMDALRALIWLGIGMALVYGALSWFLTAGLLGALRGPPPATRREGATRFGAAGATHFFAFARLWLWSIIPYAVAGVVLVVGLVFGGRDLEQRMTAWGAAGPLLLGALPGLALIALCACAVDYARVLLVKGESPARRMVAGRALLAGLRVVFTRPAAFAHYLVYLLLWAGVSVLYVGVTLGRPYAGAGGAVGLFLLRQVVAGTRFAARVATCAGQQVLVDPQE